MQEKTVGRRGERGKTFRRWFSKVNVAAIIKVKYSECINCDMAKNFMQEKIKKKKNRREKLTRLKKVIIMKK